jgi:serine/threonine protein kinase
MPNDDVPGTLDTKHGPLRANALPQSTTAPEPSASAEAAPVLDLRGYELLERLGGGGMGDVYRAGDPALGRDLAVKVMKADLQGYASAEQRFLREARITGSLQHPGIVPIYNLGRLSDGRLHYTMRLVRGRTFADILKEEAGQPERMPALLTIFEKVCQAVAYAHSKHVIHRDLKPANVMVGRFGEVQVMDWGLAKLLTAEEEPAAAEATTDEGGTRIHTEDAEAPPELTRQGREMGTPAYMPPEQALGEWDSVDERADVFALGAILCQILTGRPPYHSGDREEVLRKAKRGDCAEALARLETCGADAALLALCRECLTPAREGRPRDAEQVAQRIAAYQAEVQERLRRAELERAAAQVRVREERKRRRLAIASVVVISIAAIISGWLAVRATDAAAAEREAKELAQNRLEQIEKANEVSSSIFRDLDPRAEEKGGLSLRQQLSQHLQRAATQLDEGAVGDALATARLQVTLGRSLLNLGNTTLAMELFRKAGMTQESQLGADHPDTLNTRNDLASAYWSAGRTSEAIRLHEQTLKQRQTKLGADHPDTLTSCNNLATAYFAAGRTVEAIRLFEETLKQQEAKLEPDHPDTLRSRNNLAVAYKSVGRTAEAIPLYEQTLKQMEAKFGEDHPDTLTSRSNLAQAYKSAGRTDEAIRLNELVLKQREAKLGLDHPDTLTSRNNLAGTYSDAGRRADAIRLYEQTLKEREIKLGPDHPDTLMSRNNLASEYFFAGLTAEAIRLHEQVLKQQKDKLGPDHPYTLVSMANLGVAYREAGRLKAAIPLLETSLQRGRKSSDGLPALLAWVPGALAQTYEQAEQFQKAEPIYRDSLEQAQRQFGPDDPRTASALVQLGSNLLKQKKIRDAEPLLRQSLAFYEKKQPDAWNTFNTRLALGEALLAQKKYSQAEPLLVQGYEGMKQRQDKIPPAYRQLRLNEALERLVRLYEATGQKDKAGDYRKKLQEAKAAPKKTKS